jgi:hypothetical protein
MGLPDQATVEGEGAASEMADDPESRAGLAHRLKSGRLSPPRENCLFTSPAGFSDRESRFTQRESRGLIVRHYLSAQSFEQVARQAKARFVTGLSATVARKDGHHPIIFMQCGPVRYQTNAKIQAAAHPFEHDVLAQPTAFMPNRSSEPDKRV